MKPYKFILCVLLVPALFSCQDLLEQPSENVSYTESTDYTVHANMIHPLYGVYAEFYNRGWEYFPLISVRGDDVNAGGLGDQQDYAETDRYHYNKDYWMYNSIWKDGYKDVFFTLSAVDEINKYREAGAGNALADQYIAEAKTIRGFLLLNLTRVWGNVFWPVSSDPALMLLEEVTPKDEMLKRISDMMDEAIPHLPDVHPRDRADIRGGITKYTALAIKALANLDLKNYQAVADATAQIIRSDKFELEPDFYALFCSIGKGKLNKETLLEWQYSDYGAATGDKDTHLFGFYGPTDWTPKAGNIGAGWGFFEPSLKYIKFMLDRNETVRLTTGVLFTARGIGELRNDPAYAVLPSFISNVTPSGDIINDYPRALFASGKHYLPSDQLTPGRTEYGCNKNFICIRYAEILLMYAEALTQGASPAASSLSADGAVNLIRARAGLPALSGVTLNQVIDEKFAELAMEWGTRYYDMIRLERFDELSYDGRTFDPSKIYLPYPQAQVDELPALRAKKSM
ncbi:MAG: RagB/SusD family nutrient uptake outer membrane protein [Tannerellaceae bacterium]|jgi:hypothetical protein|nr:RagB/SusD family nutrient uptake outer membrane protein [Tannerellaceae bacterium]